MGIKATFFRVFQLTCCKATEEASPLWRAMAEKAEKRQKCTHFANLRGLMPYSYQLIIRQLQRIFKFLAHEI